MGLPERQLVVRESSSTPGELCCSSAKIETRSQKRKSTPAEIVCEESPAMKSCCGPGHMRTTTESSSWLRSCTSST